MKKLLRKIKKAGFKSISMGVETFTDGVITSKSINKQGYRNSLLTSLSYHIGSKDARDKGIRTSFYINIRL